MVKPEAIHSVNTDNPFWNLMVYADPGIGKTFLAGTSARADHDVLILRSPMDHTDTIKIHHPTHIIDEWVMRDWGDMDDAHEYLRHEKHGYRWVWPDCMSLIQEMGLDGIMEDLVAAKPHRNRYVPDKGEYGENMSRLSGWVRNMSGLDFNLGMTAHVMRYTSPKTGEEMLMPYIQGKQMPEKLCSYANVVGHLEVVHSEKHGKVRVLHTQPHDEFYAKDGFGAFPDRIVRPTIPKMEEAVTKAKKSPGAKRGGQKAATTRRTKPARKRTAATGK